MNIITPVIGPVISFLEPSQLPADYAAHAAKCVAQELKAWSLDQYQSLNFLSSVRSIQLCAAVLSATVAIKQHPSLAILAEYNDLMVSHCTEKFIF